ncbi:hypothetical protein F8388_010483 [Cannabis sativa]|uniref:Conserved oligomeric Golgi complex subunit 5 n=1 Tax=Cannabis sativa TaxID=3483 RepID=A0A7J6GSN6_CANSA|nr:hypothetical protein F8388_010483 [Cannabis sativa]
MASPALPMQRSPTSSSSPLQRLSTFKNAAPNPTTTSSSLTAASPLDSFASDPIFSAFLSSDFSSTSFSSAALSSGSPASTAEKLHQAIRLLESQLRSEVLSRHGELLSQLSSLQHADHTLATVRSAVSSLQASLRRVRSELSDPLKSIQTQTIQLSNIHRSTELLQHSIRALRLSKKLRDLISVSAADPDKLDLAKAAQLHCEILTLYNEYDLVGIDVVDEELKWVRETGDKLRSEAMKLLNRGMEGLNQAEVGTGLQVFYNLGELRATVEQLIEKYKGIGLKSVSTALDMKAITASTGGGGYGPGGIRGSGMPQIGGGGKAREALWQRMTGCMEQLHSVLVAVWHLQRVLSKKRDPFTHVLLLDEVNQLSDRVWEAIVKAFANQMKSAFTASSFVKEIFTMGYPKLFLMIENLLERISRDTDVKGVLPAISLEGKDKMIAAVDIFQTAFLTLCLSRLSDLVNSIFPVTSRGSVPSKEQISRIISRIQEEIEAVQLDARLTLLVLREIGKVLQLLAQRAEYQNHILVKLTSSLFLQFQVSGVEELKISTGPEARQVDDPATSAQLKNFAL